MPSVVKRRSRSCVGLARRLGCWRCCARRPCPPARPPARLQGFHRAVTRLVEAGCGTNAYSITERMTALGLLSKYVVPLPGLGLAPDSMADREVDLVGLARVLLEAGSDPTLPIQGPVDEGRLQGLSELDRLTVLSSPMVTVLFGAYGQIQAGGPAAWRAVEYVRWVKRGAVAI